MKIAYQSEQEQLESLQKWWKENGKSVIFGVVLGVAGMVGWSSWNAYTVRQAEKASLSYEQLVAFKKEGSQEEAIKQGESLIDEFSNSGYAELASLVVAKVALEQGDREKAKTHLEWVIKEGQSSPVQSIARLRLARLLTSEEKWTEAIALLDGEAGEFASLYEEARGDIFHAQGDLPSARTAYRKALARANYSMDRKLQARIRIKLDDLRRVPQGSDA
uniref:Ancillary SecYEG translocon subunit n=1 Tax=Candidatus Kentrum sp. MB TaxID=2138164 RepID=A0A451BFK1_9GAMM|nr:MAG: Putative negative regulator of RcsB-dependent stress response [Candidatus Kentron sp. MB]VFK77058.1 MAG: Putative negative regulator of RcsB-dependent stress response [Candidatus Kentron sp. MB]